MHMKCHCDNQEGNLCQACEQEIKEVRQEVAAESDGWWPVMAVRRSINMASSTGTFPENFMYV